MTSNFYKVISYTHIVLDWLILQSLFFLILIGCTNKDNVSNGIDIKGKILNISSNHDLLLKKTNQELFEEAAFDVDNDSITPHTIDALSVVINRYYTNPEDSVNRTNAIKAFNLLANIHMSYFIDYTKAYRYLTEAKQIAEEDKDYNNLSMLYPGLINLYLVNDSEISELQSHVINLLKEGTDYSIKSDNDKSLAAFIVDIALINSDSSGWGQYKDIIDKIRNYKFDESSIYGGISQKLISGFDNFFSGNYAKAELIFIEAGKDVESIRFGERFLFPINNFLIHVYEKTDDWNKGISIGKILLEKAKYENYKDYALWMNKTLSELYEKIGKTDSATFYHTNYLILEEEMKRENGYEIIQTLDFISQIEKISEEVQQLSFKRKEQQQHLTVIISALIILLIIVTTLIITYINLKKNHISLYRRNEEMVKREEDHKLLREQWKKEKAHLIEKLKMLSNEEISNHEPIKLNDSTSDIENQGDMNQLRSLYASILDIMETSDEIYKPGFSLNELAILMDCSPRIISRAINICHKSNFHQLLNEYRIREAIKKMNEPDSNRLTIESIAESVGFKSRTSFATLFKKITGLTPSEYWKIAKN